MKLGLEAAFAETSRTGGVRAAARTQERRRRLSRPDQAVRRRGGWRSSPSPARSADRRRHHTSRPRGAPFIGPFTGVSAAEPYKPLVLNIRASYFQETEAMVEHLTKDLGATKIAIVYQDDAFGQAGLAGVRKALARRRRYFRAQHRGR
jgi:hypothetical protein